MKNLIQSEFSGFEIIGYLFTMILVLILLVFLLKKYINTILIKIKSQSDNQIGSRTKYNSVNENKYQSSFYMLGLGVSLIVVYLFINWTSPTPNTIYGSEIVDFDDIIVSEIEIPRTKNSQKVTPPTSKTLSIPEEIQLVENSFEQLSTEDLPIIIELTSAPQTSSETKSSIPVIPPPSEKENEKKVFKIVEQMPRFPGCENVKGDNKAKEDCAKEKLLQYLGQTVKYPAIARENGIEGQAVIQFTVGKSGEIEDVIVLRDPGAGLGDAAKEAVETMNKMKEKWIPGKQRGVPVKVQYTVPLKFKLNT